ncbi:MAG TPA: creatininase family protein [Longimicrobiales bacterium]|nr:creatininase family protein [Longimicrobiales bacterium]
MSERRLRWWHDLTRPEVGEVVARDPVLVLPVGAVEQHGPHLPLSTDADIARGLLEVASREVAKDTEVLALPLLTVGTSDEHGDIPGTLSIPSAVLEETVVAVGASVARAGAQRLVLANSHGGNRASLDVAALRLRREWGLLVVKAHWFRFPRPDGVALPEAEWEHGLPGGAVETAMMLHLRPDRVDADAVADFRSLGRDLDETGFLLGPEGAASFAWMAEDLHPSGAVGDATLADAAMGERLLAHYGRTLARILDDTARFPLERLADPGA